MEQFRAFLKRKNIVFSGKRYGIDALGAMAQGLFCSLLIGTIIKTLGSQLKVQMLVDIGAYAMAVSGPAMAVAIGYALQAPPMVLFSLAAVGWASNAEGGAGGPLAVLVIAIIAAECGKAVSKETKVDLLVTPAVTIIVGVALSSAAICSVLQLTGLAGGAAVAGCCAQMVGFAVMSFRENRWGGLVSQGLGTSMLQMPNIIRNPRVWIAPIVCSAVTGPLATCLFRLEMNGAPINSGMGTCGLCGQIGVWTGWVSPSAEAVAKGAQAISPTAFDWLGLLLICFVLPAVLCPLFNAVCRRLGWVKDGDLTLS